MRTHCNRWLCVPFSPRQVFERKPLAAPFVAAWQLMLHHQSSLALFHQPVIRHVSRRTLRYTFIIQFILHIISDRMAEVNFLQILIHLRLRRPYGHSLLRHSSVEVPFLQVSLVISCARGSEAESRCNRSNRGKEAKEK